MARIRTPRRDDASFRRHIWLTLFRLVVVTVLLGGTAMWEYGLARGPELKSSPLYTVVLVTYLVSLVLALALHWRAPLAPLAVVQIAMDVGLAVAVVAYTGWSESVFIFLFAIAIVDGSLLLYRRGAVLAAGLSLAAYVPGALVAPGVHPPLHTLFAHAGAYLATAALAAYLSEQLRRTGERLAAREVDLAQITALHESIVQSVASGMLTLDAKGCVTFLNRAGEQMTGRRLADVFGRPPAWFPPLPERGSRDELTYVNARGEKLHLGFTVFPLRSRDSVEIGKAAIFQDLTQYRAMEERVQRSERLADLGRVAAGLAHELRNPLAAMTGAVELLAGDPSLSGEDRRLMEIVTREGARLEELVARFLEYARPANPRRTHTDLARMAGETLDVFAHDPAAQRVRVDRRLAPTPAWCDADQMRQVLWNLLANAAQAADGAQTRGGAGPGPIQIQVRCSPAPGGAAQLEVEDDGPGIASEDLSQIFTPFFTTKASGSGLGLATVQRVIDAHGGTVTVVSEPGKGARFTAWLPPPPEGAGASPG